MAKLKGGAKSGLVVVLLFGFGFFAGIGAVVTFLYVSGRTPMFAGEDIPPPPFFEKPSGIVYRMSRELALTQAQQKRVEQILRRTRDELHALRTEHRPTVRAILEKTRRDIGRVLSPQQLREFERLQERREKRFSRLRERFPEWGAVPPGPPPPERGLRPEGLEAFLEECRVRLELTDEQYGQVEPVLRDYALGLRSVRRRLRTGGQNSPDAALRQLQDLRSTVEAGMSAVLSEDQVAAFQKILDESRRRMQQGMRRFAVPE